MSTVAVPQSPVANWEQVRDEWLSRLSALTDEVERWAQELGWSTRRMEFKLDDSQIGTYRAPALLMQEGNIRILLEPIARFVPGADGVVDLYRMPAYDDIASLYYSNGGWHLHYALPPVSANASIREAKSESFTKERSDRSSNR